MVRPLRSEQPRNWIQWDATPDIQQMIRLSYTVVGREAEQTDTNYVSPVTKVRHMHSYTCIIGLDAQQSEIIRSKSPSRILTHETLPGIRVDVNGTLFIERNMSVGEVPVSKVVYHAIFGDDLDFLSGLALWNGPCLPNAYAMMNCRLRLPCLAHAVRISRFATMARGFLSAGQLLQCDRPHVLKWGNWHCGENKQLVCEHAIAPAPCIVEPFLEGESVRIMLIGDRAWQIHLDGPTWLKSIHDPDAGFMDIDPDLLADARQLQNELNLDPVGIDYILSESGPQLLEVNHIPNVTLFPEIWEYYVEHLLGWISRSE